MTDAGGTDELKRAATVAASGGRGSVPSVPYCEPEKRRSAFAPSIVITIGTGVLFLLSVGLMHIPAIVPFIIIGVPAALYGCIVAVAWFADKNGLRWYVFLALLPLGPVLYVALVIVRLWDCPFINGCQ